MDFSCDRDSLIPWLKRAALFADDKSPIEILRCVKLTAYDGGLTLTASNGRIQITGSLPVEGIEPGAVCVEAARLADLVGSLRADKPVEVAYNGKLLQVRSGRTKASLGTIDAAGFPKFGYPLPAEPQIKVQTDELHRVLTIASPAMGGDKDSRIFWGVSFSWDGALCTVASCNGIFGAVCRLRHDELAEFPPIILPRPLCLRLQTMLRQMNDPVEISISTAGVRLSTAAWVIDSTLLQDTFPDPRTWAAKRVETPLIVGSEELESILARIDAAVDLDSKKLKQRGAVLSIAGRVLTVRDGQSTITDTMEVDFDGEAETGVNTKHIRDAIVALDTSEVELHFNGRGTPICVCARGNGVEGYTTTPYRVI